MRGHSTGTAWRRLLAFEAFEVCPRGSEVGVVRTCGALGRVAAGDEVDSRALQQPYISIQRVLQCKEASLVLWLNSPDTEYHQANYPPPAARPASPPSH